MQKTATIKWFRKDKNYLFYGNPNYWIKYIIYNDNEQYSIVQFRSHKDFKERIENLSLQDYLNYYDFLKSNGKMKIWSKESLESSFNTDVKRQFVYKMLEETRDLILDGFKVNKFSEVIKDSKIFIMLIDKFSQDIDKEKLFVFVAKKLKYHPQQFRDMFGELPNTENSVIKYHNWNIRIIEGAKISIDTIKQFFDEVENRLQPFGFSKLCYGDVFFQSTLNSTAIADYTKGTDDIRVKTQRRPTETMVIDMIHELGHRMWWKFNIDENLFNSEFRNLKDKNMTKMIKHMVEKKNKENVNVDSEFKDSYFPTAYSKTKVTEWFAELFSYYIMGKLEEPAVSWFEKQMK